MSEMEKSNSRRLSLSPAAPEIICPNANCGYTGPGQVRTRGSVLLGVLLLLFGLVPGVLYFLFGTGTDLICPQCQMLIRRK